MTSSKITEEDLVEHWKLIFLNIIEASCKLNLRTMIDLDKQIWRFYGNIFIFFKIKNLPNTKNVPKQQFLHYSDFFKNHRGGLGRTLKIYSDILETLLKLPANWSWEQCLILTNKFDDFMGTFSFFSKLKIFLTQKMFQKTIFTLQWLLQKSPRRTW